MNISHAPLTLHHLLIDTLSSQEKYEQKLQPTSNIFSYGLNKDTLSDQNIYTYTYT